MSFRSGYRYLVMIFSSCIFFLPATAQTGNMPADNLMKQAKQMAIDFNKNNLAAFVKYTHPNVVKMVGGEAKMVEVIRSQVDKWKEEGISISSVSIGDAKPIVKAGTELHSVVAQDLVLSVPGGKLTRTSYLLATSPDKGVTWRFIDATNIPVDKLYQMFPNYNKALVIPVKKEPVFIAD
ncbi:hypothetical protein [Aridibaculum aurantiacum]|uniref:hypothetical protein n=1 Tax=Aridibaculum aurantiacum TaxID=2810307 RepID=UPI001A976A7D|nr:hypothetical protein [Aridibaculum aurantiacum]